MKLKSSDSFRPELEALLIKSSKNPRRSSPIGICSIASSWLVKQKKSVDDLAGIVEDNINDPDSDPDSGRNVGGSIGGVGVGAG